jgi:hypothetical protein
MELQRIMWPCRIKQGQEHTDQEDRDRGQRALDRNNKTDGIIQDQHNMKVLTRSTEQMGLYRIKRTNGIGQSQGLRRDYAGRPNIGQRRLTVA